MTPSALPPPEPPAQAHARWSQTWTSRTPTQRTAYVLLVAMLMAMCAREREAQVIALVASLFVLGCGVRSLVLGTRELAAPSRRLLWLAAAFALYFLLHAVRLARQADLHALDGPSRFLLLSPILFLPSLARVSWRDLGPWIAAGGVLFGVAAVTGLAHPREDRVFGWFTYLNLFGYASTALLGVLVLNPPKPRPSWWWALGILGALCASVLSGTRGAWLVTIPLLLYFVAERLWQSNHRRVLVLVLSFAALGLAASWSAVQSRFEQARTEIDRSLAANDYESSVGQRIAMWRVSVSMIQDRPWTGQGLSAFPGQMQPWADRMGLAVKFRYGGMMNPHNQYLGWAAVHGIPLALVLMALAWWTPMWAIKGLAADRRAIRTLGAFLAMVAVFGLTESVIERQRGAAWFMIWVGLIVGCAASEALGPRRPSTRLPTTSGSDACR